MIGSVDREAVRKQFDFPESFDVLLVVAFGIPAEKVVIEKVKNDNTKYYRDGNQIHHVPKLDIGDLIL